MGKVNALLDFNKDIVELEGALWKEATLLHDIGFTMSVTDEPLDEEITSSDITVSTVGAHKTIHTSVGKCLIARFVHDAYHYMFKLGFSYEDERIVNEKQYENLKDRYDLSNSALNLFWCDMQGQLDYHEEFGCFVEDQRSFVLYKAYGITH